MTGRALAAIALALLAGCGAFGPPSTPTDVTPAPVPTPEPTRSAPAYSLAPGVSADGIEDPNLLIRRHIAVATNTSYAWTERYGEAGVSQPGSYRMTRSEHTVYEDAGDGYRYLIDERLVVSGERRYVRMVERYANATVSHSRIQTENRTGSTLVRTDAPLTPTVLSLPDRPIRHFLDLENETVRAVERGDREHVAITGTRGSVPDRGIVYDLSARVVVREDGLIREVNVSYVDRIHGGTVPIRYSLSFTRVGEATVRPPAWVPPAPTRAGD